MHVFVVEDEPALRKRLCRVLQEAHFITHDFSTLSSARSALQSGTVHPGVILTDWGLPDGHGPELLETIEECFSTRVSPKVVVMTGQGSVQIAVDAMRRGARDFLLKPFESTDEVVAVVTNAAREFHLLKSHDYLYQQLDGRERMEGLVCASTAMSTAVELVQRVAPTEATVLITGESGTGKEVLARQVHLLSERRKAPYVAVNCGALSATLLESQLFGHEKGAFTGASSQHPGLFQQASGGTLFLDEIGELSPTSQVTLLRVLQEGTVRPLGGTSERTVNVRVIAATHQDLKKMVSEGEFRADLFYRINVFAIHIPPLRRRPEDVLPLAFLLLEKHAQRLRVPVPRLDVSTMDILQAHPWFGNVRELENVLERALILQTDGSITPDCLPADVKESKASTKKIGPHATFADAKLAFEREYLEISIDRAGGNLSEAARSAGLDRSNLRRLLKKHELLA